MGNCQKIRNLLLVALIAVCGALLDAGNADCQGFGLVILSSDFKLIGQGKNIDSIAFWEASDPSKSLLFVTAKENSLVEVWKFPFIDNNQPPLQHSTFSGSNVNGVVVDQEADLLYVAIGAPSSVTSVFKLPELDFVGAIGKERVSLKSEPNLALLKLPDGSKMLYVSADDIVYIHDAISGHYSGEFRPIKGLETMAADNFHQIIYIPDENHRSGVYAYKPDGSIYSRRGINNFGGDSIFDKDGEGVVVYIHRIDGQDTGEGLIVVADQRKPLTDFEIFDRKSWSHLGAFRLYGVSNTDGIASTQQTLPGYPLGLFAAVDNDTSVVCLGWDKIFDATGITFEKH